MHTVLPLRMRNYSLMIHIKLIKHQSFEFQNATRHRHVPPRALKKNDGNLVDLVYYYLFIYISCTYVIYTAVGIYSRRGILVGINTVVKRGAVATYIIYIARIICL